jgi:hypothetical protein
MKRGFVRALLTLSAILITGLVPVQAEAKHCSNASAAGRWAYTYTGAIVTQNGPVPAAAVGHFHLPVADAGGRY